MSHAYGMIKGDTTPRVFDVVNKIGSLGYNFETTVMNGYLSIKSDSVEITFYPRINTSKGCNAEFYVLVRDPTTRGRSGGQLKTHEEEASVLVFRILEQFKNKRTWYKHSDTDEWELYKRSENEIITTKELAKLLENTKSVRITTDKVNYPLTQKMIRKSDGLITIDVRPPLGVK